MSRAVRQCAAGGTAWPGERRRLGPRRTCASWRVSTVDASSAGTSVRSRPRSRACGGAPSEPSVPMGSPHGQRRPRPCRRARARGPTDHVATVLRMWGCRPRAAPTSTRRGPGRSGLAGGEGGAAAARRARHVACTSVTHGPSRSSRATIPRALRATRHSKRLPPGGASDICRSRSSPTAVTSSSADGLANGERRAAWRRSALARSVTARASRRSHLSRRPSVRSMPSSTERVAPLRCADAVAQITAQRTAAAASQYRTVAGSIFRRPASA